MKSAWLMALFTVLITVSPHHQAAALPVYFGTRGPESKGIYRANFETETGALSKVELAATVQSPEFLALHPHLKTLYAVARTTGEPAVVAYEVKSDGSLRPTDHSPIGDGSGTHIAVHPSGKFLLTAQYGGGSVALFPLDPEGKLGPPGLTHHSGGSRVVEGRQDAPHPHWCGFSPDGRFALVPDLGLDGIVIYRINVTAPSIERHGFAASVPGGGARHMRFSTNGRFIFLLNEMSLSVTTFEWDTEHGVAQRRATVAALSPEVMAQETFNAAAEIVVHPSAPLAYSSNRGNDSVTVYRVDAPAGTLEPIQVQPIRGAWPRHINLTPDGNWLLAAGADSNTVSVHQVDPTTGELTYRRKSVVNVPSPICILFGR